jgi:pyridoxamine 5'-phosphate oxidase
VQSRRHVIAKGGAATVDPLKTLADWIDEARTLGAPEPEAMALATATGEGVPSVRIVLCRGIDARGLRFFTNYESRKGGELADNHRAAVVFFWPVIDRQVRVEGEVERLGSTESDEYFQKRPRGHRLSALASPQSRPLASLDELRRRAAEVTAEYEGKEVPRPAYWGGYLLRPSAIELWIRGADRLHDRERFEMRGGAWACTRLAP